MKAVKIVQIIFCLILGGMMLYGGMKKFGKPSPSPTELIEQVKTEQEVAPSLEILKIKNYVFGMKQTNFFWQFLGFAELLAGLLLVSLVFSRIGAIVALPITINIFLFHLFLEPDEVGELVQMLGLLIINILLLASSYKIWKPLVYDKTLIQFKV
ncbi:DoxX family membrane protein [Flavobacterium sp. SM2513]|uniref:DoxX family membrane protein n=1 Tax=Flavobacterium sp. SM2513 TaxID=3424766 RepID=UPI003D7FBD02